MSYYRFVDSKTRVKRHKNRKKTAIFFTVLFFIVIIGTGIWVYWKSMTPAIIDFARADVRNASAKAVNEAVYSVMSVSIKYDDLITVQKNANNEVTLIQANSVLINSLARDTALLVQKGIDDLKDVGVNVPLGTMTGIALFSGMGPELKISVRPIGSVICTFVSEFETAGINQTLHKIYLKVNCRVDVVIPSAHTVIETNTPVLVSESIIVGKVPDVFLQGSVLCSTADKYFSV